MLICSCSASGLSGSAMNFWPDSEAGSSARPLPSLTNVASQSSGIFASRLLVYVLSNSAAMMSAEPSPSSPHAAIRIMTPRFTVDEPSLTCGSPGSGGSRMTHHAQGKSV
ncbi:Uncharacterised protein [Mycobacteroides abscessus]|nr:Uncharacterised protein [Mycobacteroides abscessus]SKT43833.1 Uncharacterised protein [Mycobacteroides abscessus subsp. abscessus]